MSAREELIVRRMEGRLAALYDVIPPLRPDAAYWLNSDGGPSYCSRCVRIARGKEFDLGAPLEEVPYHRRDEWEDAFYEGIDGGFDTTSDSAQACEICGCTLSYILTDYGVEEEVGYYREAPLCELRDEDSYALNRLALNIWPGAPRHQILGVSMAVGQAYRLLTRSTSQRRP